MRRLIRLGALASVIYLAGYWEIHRPLRAVDAPPKPLIVAPGGNAESIGRQLHEMGLVRHPALFRALVLLRGVGGRLRAGEYSLEGPLSLDEIVGQLARGEVVRRELTFPEGKTIEEMAQLAMVQGIAPAAFTAAARQVKLIADLDAQATDLEGYLFPDTYDVSRRPDAGAELVARMVRRFRDVVGPELPGLAERGQTLRPVVTLASLVELETAQSAERPRIAAVFLNRLKRGMLLQTDPTVIYALRKAGRYDGNIRKPDLDLESPYNTYRYAGLPPGPIASPGRESLEAALHPAPVDDLYFVSRNDGTHQFSRTLAEHERAVDQYQRHRGGAHGPGGR
jgi:UPF0755 protein